MHLSFLTPKSYPSLSECKLDTVLGLTLFGSFVHKRLVTCIFLISTISPPEECCTKTSSGFCSLLLIMSFLFTRRTNKEEELPSVPFSLFGTMESRNTEISPFTPIQSLSL